MNKLRKTSAIDWILWILFAAVFLFLCFFMYKKAWLILDSDMSSEMVLSKLLADEGGLLTKNWYYSTEIRVLNSQIISSLLFRTTDNWHTVRVLTCWIMYLIYMASFWCFCEKTDCKKLFPVFAAVLLLPFSGGYFQFVLIGLYYIPHIAITLVTVGTFFCAVNCRTRRGYVEIGLLALLALAAGLGGPRQILVLYLPLAMTGGIFTISEWLRKKKNFFSLSVTLGLLFFSLLGYFINTKVLSSHYLFKTWGALHFIIPDSERVIEVLSGFLVSFGFKQSLAFSSAIISNGFAAVIIGLSLTSLLLIKRKWNTVSKETQFVTAFYLCSLACFFAIELFTDSDTYFRYNIPIIVFSIPVFMLFVRDCIDSTKMKTAAVAVFTCAFLIPGGMNFISALGADSTGEYREIRNYLLDGGYKQGYATFWDSNILTELSDGEIDVYDWGDDILIVNGVGDLYEWLQLKEHFEKPPEGKIFVLLHKWQSSHCKWANELRDDRVVMETDSRYIYSYDSYEQMMDEIGHIYPFDFSDEEYPKWLYNGIDQNGKRYIFPRGASFGPYISLEAGDHSVVIKGENLEKATIDCSSGNGEQVLATNEEQLSDNLVKLCFSLDVDADGIETRVVNNSDTVITISNIYYD